MSDSSPTRTRFRVGRLVAIIAVALTVLAALAYGLVDFSGVFEPSHYVSITNNTRDDVNWSCSWSKLHLSPGSTGRIRIWNHPDQDFGCVSGADTATEIDTCPDLPDMRAGRHFTVTSWNRQFTCP